jgi:hypothetical protein
MMAERHQGLFQMFFEMKARVVRADRDAHVGMI